MPITTVTPPAELPVTLAEVKEHARIEEDDGDAYLGLLMKAATETVEGETWRHLVERTIDWSFDHFTPSLVIPVHPVRSIESITYLDGAGVDQTVDPADYRLLTGGDRGPAEIVLAYNAVWPLTQPVRGAITVRMVTGWATTAEIWTELRLGLLALVAHWYRNREAFYVGRMSHEAPEYILTTLRANRLPV